MRTVPLWKAILLIALLAYGCYLLYPSVVWYSQLASLQDPNNPQIPKSEELNQLNDELSALLVSDSTDEIKIDDLRDTISKTEKGFYALRDKRVRLGLDLNGGIHLRLRVIVTPDAEPAAQEQEVDQVLMVYRERIDKLGLTEPIVEKQPGNVILIQIPGVTNPEQVLDIIKTTAQLKFQLSPGLADGQDVLSCIDEKFKSNLQERLQPIGGGSVCSWRVAGEDIRFVSDTVFSLEARRDCWSVEHGFYWSDTEKDSSGKPFKYLYMLEEKADVTGEYIENARVAFEQSVITEPYIRLEFKKTGTRRFATLTRNNVKRHLAVVLDGIVYSAPVINEAITQGVAAINGRFSVPEAQKLALVLEAGALQRPVEVIQNITVGAQMGYEAIQKGTRAFIIGVIAVVLFMIIYYGFCGIVADMALVLNVFFVAAGLALFQATLTMPGIAGVVLLLGMAVDANVLVFERMREERRADRAPSVIVDRGYSRALSAIVDGNLTTLITAVVLFQFGTGPIKGFAVTLSMGLIISLFTSLFVTRMVFDWRYGSSKPGDKMSIGS